MTAVLATTRGGTAGSDAAAFGLSLEHGLGWLWRSYVTVVQAFIHHQVPPPMATAAFAVTVAFVLAVAFRRRRPAA